MRIVQTPARFYPFIGGVENYVYNLSKELVNLGQEVQIICAMDPSGIKEETIDNIKIKRLSYVGKVANTNITPGLPLALLGQDFDLIHAHLPTPWSADWSALLSIAKKKPMVLTYHNDIVGMGFAGQIARLYNFACLPRLLKAAEKIIITQPNYAISSIYLKRYENKLKILPNGVNSDRFRPNGRQRKETDGNKVLFFLGLLDKFHRYKGLDYLLEALVIAKKQMPDVKLVVGGDGELLNYYHNMVMSLGLRKNVDFLGFVPEEKLAEHYNRCDAFVLPSISSEQEGFGIVLLEAMASGRPVISTDIVGVAEDVMRFNAGRIVRPRDINALARAIIEILLDEELAQEMENEGGGLWRRNILGRKSLRIC